MTRIDSHLQKPEKIRPRVALTVNMKAVGKVGGHSAAIRRLMQMVDEHRLDTTWVVDHASQLAWVATLQDSSTRHEVALDATWATQELSAGKFQRQFRDRWEMCDQVGIAPTTIYNFQPALLRQRLCYFAQYGLTTCIAGHPNTHLGSRQSGPFDCLPRPLPLGLWQLPTTAQLPSKHPWLRRTPIRQLPGARGDRSSVTGMHVQIDAEQVIDQGRGGLKQIDHFLYKVAWANSAHQLEVMTAAEWTNRVACGAAAKPQRSILHIAA